MVLYIQVIGDHHPTPILVWIEGVHTKFIWPKNLARHRPHDTTDCPKSSHRWARDWPKSWNAKNRLKSSSSHPGHGRRASFVLACPLPGHTAVTSVRRGGPGRMSQSLPRATGAGACFQIPDSKTPGPNQSLPPTRLFSSAKPS
jgi:hypothetical protein